MNHTFNEDSDKSFHVGFDYETKVLLIGCSREHLKSTHSLMYEKVIEFEPDHEVVFNHDFGELIIDEPHCHIKEPLELELTNMYNEMYHIKDNTFYEKNKKNWIKPKFKRNFKRKNK